MRRIMRLIAELQAHAADPITEVISLNGTNFTGATGMSFRDYVQKLGWRTDTPSGVGNHVVSVVFGDSCAASISFRRYGLNGWEKPTNSILSEKVIAWMEMPEAAPYTPPKETRGLDEWVNIDEPPQVPGLYLFHYTDGAVLVRDWEQIRNDPEQECILTHWRQLPEAPFVEDPGM